MNNQPHILFLCTGNSCRSQMAEGWATALLGERIEPFSAGTEARGVDPRAICAMAEAGIDISGQRSKTISELTAVRFDLVVTLCDSAAENCPVFSGGARLIHVPFDDPPALAQGAPDDEQAMAPYRRVRDEIRRFIEKLEI